MVGVFAKVCDVGFRPADVCSQNHVLHNPNDPVTRRGPAWVSFTGVFLFLENLKSVHFEETPS